MAKTILLCVLCVLVCAAGQRITTIHLDGVQYFISRMNPYSPELNYFLAYQYCRSLGLQLASFETKEKAESMTTYLKNAGYGNYDFWSSGNRLGTGMFLWMSTGLPFNATFDFFENTAEAMQGGLLDPVDHNSNTAPQRTARDSTSNADKACVILKQPTLKWMPEDCSAIKDFICEQTRCYYYNYGSIPVSSAQGRPITSTTSKPALINIRDSTTSLPILSSTYASFIKKDSRADDQEHFKLLKTEQEHDAIDEEEPESEEQFDLINLNNDQSYESQETSNSEVDNDQARELNDIKTDEFTTPLEKHHSFQEVTEAKTDNTINKISSQDNNAKGDQTTSDLISENSSIVASKEDVPSVEERLKQISQEVEKIASNRNQHVAYTPVEYNHDNDDIGRQSFLSLTDLIRTLRPNDKQIIPQIDSDYSNAMRVLGENGPSKISEPNMAKDTPPILMN